MSNRRDQRSSWRGRGNGRGGGDDRPVSSYASLATGPPPPYIDQERGDDEYRGGGGRGGRGRGRGRGRGPPGRGRGRSGRGSFRDSFRGGRDIGNGDRDRYSASSMDRGAEHSGQGRSSSNINIADRSKKSIVGALEQTKSGDDSGYESGEVENTPPPPKPVMTDQRRAQEDFDRRGRLEDRGGIDGGTMYNNHRGEPPRYMDNRDRNRDRDHTPFESRSDFKGGRGDYNTSGRGRGRGEFDGRGRGEFDGRGRGDFDGRGRSGRGRGRGRIGGRFDDGVGRGRGRGGRSGRFYDDRERESREVGRTEFGGRGAERRKPFRAFDDLSPLDGERDRPTDFPPRRHGISPDAPVSNDVPPRRDGPRDMPRDVPTNRDLPSQRRDGIRDQPRDSPMRDDVRNLPSQRDGLRDMPRNNSIRDGPRDLAIQRGGMRDMPRDGPIRESSRDLPLRRDGPRDISRDVPNRDGQRDFPPRRDGPRDDFRDGPIRDGPRDLPSREEMFRDGPRESLRRDELFRDGPRDLPRRGEPREFPNREQPGRVENRDFQRRDGMHDFPQRNEPGRDDGPRREFLHRDGSRESQANDLRNFPRDAPRDAPRAFPRRDEQIREGPRDFLRRDEPTRNAPRDHVRRDGPRDLPRRDEMIGGPSQDSLRDGPRDFREPMYPREDDRYQMHERPPISSGSYSSILNGVDPEDNRLGKRGRDDRNFQSADHDDKRSRPMDYDPRSNMNERFDRARDDTNGRLGSSRMGPGAIQSQAEMYRSEGRGRPDRLTNDEEPPPRDVRMNHELVHRDIHPRNDHADRNFGNDMHQGRQNQLSDSFYRPDFPDDQKREFHSRDSRQTLTLDRERFGRGDEKPLDNRNRSPVPSSAHRGSMSNGRDDAGGRGRGGRGVLRGRGRGMPPDSGRSNRDYNRNHPPSQDWEGRNNNSVPPYHRNESPGWNRNLEDEAKRGNKPLPSFSSYSQLALNDPKHTNTLSATATATAQGKSGEGTSEKNRTSATVPAPAKEAKTPPVPRAPTPPPKGKPTGVMLALTRLFELEASMEYAYAKHMQLIKRQQELEEQYKVLETLPVGIESIIEDLETSPPKGTKQ